MFQLHKKEKRRTDVYLSSYILYNHLMEKDILNIENTWRESVYV